VPENLLGLLKICLLILIYLFFVRVLWAVWSEVRAVRPQTEPGGRPPHDDRAAGPVGAGGAPARARHGAPGVPQQLLIEMPADRRGARFQLSGPELTIGRAGGCHIALPNDTFASRGRYKHTKFGAKSTMKSLMHHGKPQPSLRANLRALESATIPDIFRCST